tara:strand:+ start:713 stop:967 length:255 start_codon:yes stop_codon:yes gene_type:complete
LRRIICSRSKSDEFLLKKVNENTEMPLTKKGKKIMGAMKKQYGLKKGKQVFYASKNKGNISMVDQTQINWQDKVYEGLLKNPDA